MENLPVAILTEKRFSFYTRHQLPIAPQLWMGFWDPLHAPCWDFYLAWACIGLVLVSRTCVSCWGQQWHHVTPSKSIGRCIYSAMFPESYGWSGHWSSLEIVTISSIPHLCPYSPSKLFLRYHVTFFSYNVILRLCDLWEFLSFLVYHDFNTSGMFMIHLALSS